MIPKRHLHMKIDLKALRQLTAQAIVNGEKEREDEFSRIVAKKARKDLQAELLANQIISQILIKCEKEAIKERSQAVIMELKLHRDYTFDTSKGNIPGPTKVEPENLIGAGKIVYQYCVDNGLNPKINYWWDGIGLKSGYNILVYW